MPRTIRTLLLCLTPCLLFLIAPCAAAQAVFRNAAPNLRAVVRRSGTIFVGKVTSIESPRSPCCLNMVRVTFSVEQAMRGDIHVGEHFSIREWAGLWSAGPRYRIGERLVLFLYPPSKLGLTSPVDGKWGRVPVGRDGVIQLWPAWKQIVPPALQSDVPLFARAVRRLAEER
jgi:hypothetical protein